MINRLAHYITFDLLKHVPETPLGESVHFFIYDTIKILFLLLIITHLMSLLRYYLPVEKMRKFLISRKFYGADYFLASSFGALTPFCSCSSIPLFIGFIQAGIPLGLTFAFLITSPLVNEVAIVLFISIFGWKITLLYTAAGMIIGMTCGYILGKMKLDGEVNADLFQEEKPCGCAWKAQKERSVLGRISHEARGITAKVAPYVVIGVGLGAVIHGYVPEGYFENSLTGNSLLSVPLAVLLAVPLYANASGVIPIIEALIAKGVALGTALAFMMAVVGLSLPEALILKKVMSLKLLLIFFGMVAIAIVIVGYGFNMMTL